MDFGRFSVSLVGGKIVAGGFDGVSFDERFDMAEEKSGINCVGVVEIRLAGLLFGEVGEVFVVPIDAYENGGVLEMVYEALSEPGLSRPASASDCDDFLGWVG